MSRFMRKGSKILAFFVALMMTSFVCIDASFFAVEANAETVISAEKIVENMGLGWNLGNSLDSTGDGGASGQEISWGNPRVTKDLINAVKAKGFNTVRVPITWYKSITENNGSYTINADWLARVKEVVDYAYDNGMYVIINIHHENWINRVDLATSYDAMSKELKQVWAQIAEYFSDYDQHLIFEGMNEPRMEGAAEGEWTGNAACYEVINKLDADFISTVRSVDSAYKSTRLLMVPGYAASVDYAVYSNLDKSLFDDPYVAASIHAYTPYDFAMGSGDHTTFSSSYKAALDSTFGSLRSFFTQDGIPVVIGEFSASNYGNTDARVEWAEYYMTLAKEIGAACVLWDNNVKENNGGEAHGYINRSDNTWNSVSEPVVNKLLSVRNDSRIAWAGKSSYPMYAHNDSSSGTSVNVANDGNIPVADISGFASGKELAIKYSSQTAPAFALMNATWGGWIELSAYDYSYSNSGNTAYLKYDDVKNAWDSSANGELAHIKISNYANISFSGAVILDVKNADDGKDDTDTDKPVKLEIAKNRLSMGYERSAYITDSGDLYIWGNNSNGEIGNGSKDNSSKPIKIASNVSQVSLGGTHSAYVTESGDLYVWGANTNGQIGNGTNTSSTTPIKIMSDVVQVSLGSSHSGCITSDGSLYMWGYNKDGQLGNGTTTRSNVPVKIMDNVAKLDLGGTQSACITISGDLYVWGNNDSGQLGNGTKVSKKKPQKIMSGAAQVSLERMHSSCITDDGDLYMWGSNGRGSLGDGTETDSLKPKKIMSGVAQAALGGYFSACVTENGDLYTWGYNGSGQLGNGTDVDKHTPTKIMSGVSEVSASAGSCACVTTSGELYTWGCNSYGELGDGTAIDSNSPIKVAMSHTHTFENDGKYFNDANNHWLVCTGCGETVRLAAHVRDSGTVTVEPTETTEGEKVYKCTVCGYELGKETIAKLEHIKHVAEEKWTYDDSGHWHNCTGADAGCDKKLDFAAHTEDKGTVTTQPTTDAEGVKTYKCKICGHERTEPIPKLSDSAVAVTDGTVNKAFDDLPSALKEFKASKNALTITLNEDANVKTLALPTKAESITFTGTGALNISATSISIPANTNFDVEVNGKGKTLAIRVSAGKTLNINNKTTNIGAVSGTKTSTLNINSDTEVQSITTFGTVTADDGKTLTVTGRLTVISSLNGTVKFPTAKATAATVTVGKAEIILVSGNIAKVNLVDVADALNVKVVNENDEAADLASGTIVLYSTKNIAERTTIENQTAEQETLNPYYYKKTRAVKAEWPDAVTLKDGSGNENYPNLELALANITDRNEDYTITLNTDVTEPKFVLPKTANSITIDGTGTLTTSATTITAFVDTTIGCAIKQSAGKAIALKASANKTLTLSAKNSFGAVSGSKSSTLVISEDVEALSVATFGNVNVDSGTLTVTSRLSAISNLNGTVKLPTAKATAMTVTVGEAELVLTDGDIAKATIADITTKLHVRVVDKNNSTVKLASGTTVLYGTKDISEKVEIENKTGDDKELGAFFYKRNKAVKAEWAGALTLEGKNYPNIELALDAINDKTKSTDYTITLNTDISASAFALPATAKSIKITSVSADAAKTINLTNITTVSAKTPLTLENVKLESTKPYTLSTTSDLTLNKFASDSITAVKGGANAVLTLGETTPVDKVSGFGTTRVTNEFTTGTTFTTTDLELTDTAELTVSKTKAPATVKTVNGAEGSVIILGESFMPIKVTGTTVDSISGKIKLKAAENAEVTDTTALFTTKYAGNNVFDISDIQPDGTECVVTVINGKAYMKPIVLELGDEKYALWTDVITAIETAKESETEYTVKLLDDTNIGAFKLPKAGTYGKLTISSDSKTLTFTGSITLTGKLAVTNTNISPEKSSSRYTISTGKYAFTAENADLGLAGISGTGDVTLKKAKTTGTVKAANLDLSETDIGAVTVSGTLALNGGNAVSGAVTAGTLDLGGTNTIKGNVIVNGVLTLNGVNTVFGTIKANELGSTEDGAKLNILSNASGVMSVTKNGITGGSKNITIKLIDSEGNAVQAAASMTIASSFVGSYNNELKLSTENGEFNIALDGKKLVLESVNSETPSDGLLEPDEEEPDETEPSEEEPADEPNDETPDDDTSDETPMEDTSDNDINEETENDDMTDELSA